MSMVVNHNLMATRTANALNSHYGKLAISTQRLSTGLRINSAADDAAGLAIRELQRADIAAFHQGVRNLNDGISMAQVADGTLSQLSSILQRLTELSEQAATGTYDSTQRQMIANEAHEMTREIERMQIAASFNGIDLFQRHDIINIHWGTHSDDYIPLELNKTTTTTLGASIDNTNMAYSVLKIDGGNLGKPMTSNTLAGSTVHTLADQTIYLGDAPHPVIEISGANQNNTANRLAADILALGMDGIRYAINTSELTLEDWDRSDLNGSEGDMVKFLVAVQLEDGTIRQEQASYLIGPNDAQTADNRHAALERVAKAMNTVNTDSDLSAKGDTLVSTNGRTISVGEMQYFDSSSIVLYDFNDTPPTRTATTTPPIPESKISFEVDGTTVTFTSSGDPNIDVGRAYEALKATGLPVYDNPSFINDDTYPWPHERPHDYMFNLSGGQLSIIKINDSFDRAGDNIDITGIRNNQTQMEVSFPAVYNGEKTTIEVDGRRVTFSGTYASAAEAINNAGIANVRAGVDTQTGHLIIAKTNSEQPINFRYIDDENTGVTFENFATVPTGSPSTSSRFNLGGSTITYNLGHTQEETALNLASAINSGGFGTAEVRNNTVVFHGTSHDNFHIGSFSGGTPFSVRPAAGSSVNGNWTSGFTVSDNDTDIRIVNGKGSLTVRMDVGRATTPSSGTQPYVPGIIGGPATVSASKASVDASTLNNASNDPSSTLTNRDLNESPGNDACTADWIDDGQRVNAKIVGKNPERASILSQEHGATPDNVWVSIAGTSEIYMDPTFDFVFRSDVSGMDGESGAFYQEAYRPAVLEHRQQNARQKTFVTDFDNVPGEVISMTIQGIDIHYTVPNDPTNPHQKNNAWALLAALKDKQDELTAKGISFYISAGEDGVYIFNDEPGDIVFGNYSGNAASDSGLTLKNIDNEMQTVKIHENTDDPGSAITGATMRSFTPISQIDYKTQAGAQSGLVILKEALNQVSQIRADIGAFVSVLENQTTAVQIQAENLQAAESRISDVDIATEMTEYVRNQILTQAATAMLSQANSLPQMTMQLIGG